MDVDPPLNVDSKAILFAKLRTVRTDNSMLPATLARQPVVIEIDETREVLSEIESTLYEEGMHQWAQGTGRASHPTRHRYHPPRCPHGDCKEVQSRRVLGCTAPTFCSASIGEP